MRYIWGFLIGAVIGGGAALAMGILALDQGWVIDRDGGAAMGIIFFITPAAALGGGVLGMMVAKLRSMRQP